MNSLVKTSIKVKKSKVEDLSEENKKILTAMLVNFSDDSSPYIPSFQAKKDPGRNWELLDVIDLEIMYTEQNGIITSFVLYRMAGKFISIDLVFTEKCNRRKGLSREILNNLLREYPSTYYLYELHVYPDNISAFNLYKSLGFDIVSVWMGK